jgi:hypothetical protein
MWGASSSTGNHGQQAPGISNTRGFTLLSRPTPSGVCSPLRFKR